MATRNLIMVVDRKHSSKYPEGFAIHPDLVNKHSYVNMYMHHDGYPEWQGVQIANWLLAKNNGCMDGARLASKLVHDMYYDSCYLYNSADRIDHEYRYIIWSGDKDKIHVSCWNMYSNECVFVLKPEKIISKYMGDYDYTDFANGEKRLMKSQDPNFNPHINKKEIAKYNKVRANAQKIIDILTHED
tara:strand:- start:1042 stop:1602 length:561 start_codon:yes stop_codon:yes gene_type:complete